jgi:hypothetical protein
VGSGCSRNLCIADSFPNWDCPFVPSTKLGNTICVSVKAEIRLLPYFVSVTAFIRNRFCCYRPLFLKFVSTFLYPKLISGIFYFWGLYPVAPITTVFLGFINRNCIFQMFFIITLKYPLYVSAPTGYLQVEYIYWLLPKKLFFSTTDKCLRCNLIVSFWCLYIFLCCMPELQLWFLFLRVASCCAYYYNLFGFRQSQLHFLNVFYY